MEYHLLGTVIGMLLTLGTVWKMWGAPITKWRYDVEHEIDKLKGRNSKIEKMEQDITEIKMTLVRIEGKLNG